MVLEMSRFRFSLFGSSAIKADNAAHVLQLVPVISRAFLRLLRMPAPRSAICTNPGWRTCFYPRCAGPLASPSVVATLGQNCSWRNGLRFPWARSVLVPPASSTRLTGLQEEECDRRPLHTLCGRLHVYRFSEIYLCRGLTAYTIDILE